MAGVSAIYARLSADDGTVRFMAEHRRYIESVKV